MAPASDITLIYLPLLSLMHRFYPDSTVSLHLFALFAVRVLRNLISDYPSKHCYHGL
jgi:hypothetical protein